MQAVLGAKRILLTVAAALILTGALLVSKSAYFYSRGFIAQFLIERAWDEYRKVGEPVEVPGFDGIYPAGRLIIPSVDISSVLLGNSTEESLALGPGYIEGTARPEETGNTAIAGHRDTFFRPLRRIKKGDIIILEYLTGTKLYKVDDIRIVEPTDSQWLEKSLADLITLITCYPFDYVGAAPKRFIVRGSLIKLSEDVLYLKQVYP
jgi:sortase A